MVSRIKVAGRGGKRRKVETNKHVFLNGMCVCVCVCERERERQRDRDRDRDRETQTDRPTDRQREKKFEEGRHVYLMFECVNLYSVFTFC